MTINDPVKFCAGLWDWAILDGCFGETKIKPTDVDGLVERHGKFLVFETKSPGVSIPFGQTITFKSMVSTGVFTIIVVWGETNKPIKALLYTRHGETVYDPCDIDRFRNIVSQWFKYANSDFVPD